MVTDALIHFLNELTSDYGMLERGESGVLASLFLLPSRILRRLTRRDIGHATLYFVYHVLALSVALAGTEDNKNRESRRSSKLCGIITNDDDKEPQSIPM